jgi:hypothetical protein
VGHQGKCHPAQDLDLVVASARPSTPRTGTSSSAPRRAGQLPK